MPLRKMRFDLLMTREALNQVELAAFAREHPLAVLSTVTPDARSESALVSVAVAGNGEIIANCKADARKVANIRHNPAVSLVVGTEGDVSYQIEGVARIAEGGARDEAVRLYRERFPSSRAGQAGIELIIVTPHWVRVYDVSESRNRASS